MEKIIEKLMVKSTSSGESDAHALAFRLEPPFRRQLTAAAELVSTPDLPQPKVNKCLIALVAKKLVTKTSTGVSDGPFQGDADCQGKTLYNWQGP